MGNFVHHSLAGESGVGGGGGAVRSGLGLVDENVIAVDLHVFDVVGGEDALGPGGNHRTGEGAGFIGQIGVGRNDGAIILGAHLDLDVSSGRRAGGLEYLVPGHDHLYGLPGVPGHQRGQRLKVYRNLPAKPASNLHGHHGYLGYRQIQRPGQGIPCGECALGAGPHGQVAVGVPQGGGVVRLDVALVDGSGAERALHDNVGFLEPLVYVPLLVPQVRSDVAGLVGALPQLRGGYVVMQQSSRIFHGLSYFDV